MAFAQKEYYIRRTFDLARRAFHISGSNPCVGSVLVHKDKIIGEGYYKKFGGPHAEVDCINSVKAENEKFIADSTLYVSLEPCSIYGKTPPCANFILQNDIKKVVISCLDPNPKIRGNGVKILQENGVHVELGVLQHEGEDLIHKFKVNILQKRAFVSLKWAQSIEGYAGKIDESVWYTNPYSQILVHKLRSQYEAILVGSNTVNLDNPALNNRLFQVRKPTMDPIKIIIDRQESCNKNSKLFHFGSTCIIYTHKLHYINPNESNCDVVIVDRAKDFWLFLLDDLFAKGITGVLVEGGPTIQKSFIQSNLWDEAHVLSSNSRQSSGIRAPRVTGRLTKRLSIGSDTYQHILPEQN